MAKQVKVSKTSDRITTRSPKTNLIFAVILGLLFLVLFQGSPQGAVVYAIGAFMFFNTVDYCILYYRLNKKEIK